MEQKAERFYPSAQLESKNIEIEQRLEKKLKDVNGFNILVNSIKDMNTYLRYKIGKSKK